MRFASCPPGGTRRLAVGTPIDADGRSYDTGQVFGAARALAPHLNRPCVVIGKSTVTVGTSRDLAALLARLAPAGDDVEVVWNPEFLREGHAIEDTLRPDRIVAGVPSPHAEDVVREVYAPLLQDQIPLYVTTPATAELIKGAANAYLGMKISFINGVADMCAAAGADVQQLTEVIGLDPRIGRGGLNAGPGYGGGCLPKDVRAFTASAHILGALDAAALLRAAELVNESRPTAALHLIEETLGRPVDDVRPRAEGGDRTLHPPYGVHHRPTEERRTPRQGFDRCLPRAMGGRRPRPPSHRRHHAPLVSHLCVPPVAHATVVPRGHQSPSLKLTVGEVAPPSAPSLSQPLPAAHGSVELAFYAYRGIQLGRGFCDEDGNGYRARGITDGCVGYCCPDGAGDFQGTVSGRDRELDLDVSAGWIVLLLHPDWAASQLGGEAGDARNGRRDAGQLPDGPPQGLCSGRWGRASRGCSFRRGRRGLLCGPRPDSCLCAFMEIRDAQIRCHGGQAEPLSSHVEQCAPQLFGGLV
ncbi:nucleotide sugar dehydrogenase [Streptomyces sp. NPDC055287]